MNKTMDPTLERRIVITHDGLQHCTAERLPDGNTIPMDCPYTGKGVEFSPTNMVEAAIGGCILISMGTLAMRSDIDISGTKIDVKATMTDKPRMRLGAIGINVTMPEGLSEKDRRRLEGAAEHCPIKHSFAPDMPISVNYNYPD
jgi:putative redox protein